jgi:threonine/homoserine/homoserine lactone efflux protein
VDLEIARKGLVLGFAIAAPVGPIGVLVIRRSVAYGAAAGLATGLGAALGDTVFALTGALGLAAATSLVAGSLGFRVAGALALGYLGARTVVARPPESQDAASPPPPSRWGAFASTFFLTLANPATIVSFAAAFAALGPGIATRATAVVFSSSVLVGSMAWWLLLSAATGALRARISRRALRAINVASGVLILAFALASLAHAISSMSPPR